MDGKSPLEVYFPRLVLSTCINFIICVGTLLNSKSQITPTTVKALKEVLSRGVKVVIATGKVGDSASLSGY